MKNVLRVVNVVAAVIIAVALVVLLRVVFTPAGEVPSIGGYSFLRTLTGSMEPAIPVHSLVVVQETPAEELQVGDIITYVSTSSSLEGSLNTHRITQVNNNDGKITFRTKGDANAVEDNETISPENVVGRVVFVSTAVGVVASLLSNPLLFFPLIIIPLAILLAIEIRKLIQSSQDVARAEEEAALRAAVAQIRRKRELEAAEGASEDSDTSVAADKDSGEGVAAAGEGIVPGNGTAVSEVAAVGEDNPAAEADAAADASDGSDAGSGVTARRVE